MISRYHMHNAQGISLSTSWEGKRTCRFKSKWESPKLDSFIEETEKIVVDRWDI